MNIRKVGIIGCGLMGGGIVQVTAQSGYETVVRELNQEQLDKGLGRISAFLDKGVAKNKMTQEDRDATWARIHGTTKVADLADCDLIIEVIFENMEAKKELFKELDSVCKESTIFASNTSSLSIAEMASVTNRPQQVGGLHYFFPSVINRLLEVVATEQTSPEVLEALLTFARTTDKVPIVVKDAPGFAVNRFFVPWLNEATRILDEGLANIPTIDEAACETFRIGMGPFALMNATGVPIAYHSATSLGEALGAFYAPSAALEARFQSGEPWDLEGKVDASAKTAVGERLLGVVFGVAAKLVEEGVATAGDTDRGAKVGLRWSKGPFAMMNDMGLAKAIALVEAAAKKAPAFSVPKLMTQQAKAGPWELPDVILTVKDHIAIITMNRPEAMNALNEKVLTELKAIVDQVGSDPDVRAVIVTGEGPSFVAGADIKTMLSKDLKGVREYTQFGQSVLSDIAQMPKPVIAAINGFALGGGMELALACDIRLASTQARMGLPEVGLGIFPGFGGTQRLTRLIGKGRACELIFTGDQITAEQAASMGIVNRVVAPQQLLAEARRMARRIAAQGPLAVAGAKAAINQTLQVSLDEGLAFELDGIMATFETQDQKEGMTAFLERRPATFKGE